jgi:hypothetical protein
MMSASDAALIVAIIGVGLIWAGARLVRRPGNAARAMRTWHERRWLRDEDVPAWARDEEHHAWGFKHLGRWLIGTGVLILLWLLWVAV